MISHTSIASILEAPFRPILADRKVLASPYGERNSACRSGVPIARRKA